MDAKGKRGLRPALPVDGRPESEAPVTTAPAAEAVPAAPALPPPAEEPAPAAAAPPAACERDVWAALVESQAAVARGLEALSCELAALTRSGIDTAARTASGMLSVRTLYDAIEINAGFARCSFDTMVGGAAKLSELGLKLAADASRPILEQIGEDWARAARLR